MRLSQLARRLSLKPSEVVEFLGRQNIRVEDRLNARIDSDMVALVVKHFSPSLLDELMKEDAADEVAVPSEPNEVQNPEPYPAPQTANQADEASSADSPAPEVIRAPKVELPGLRVVGKIDLPESRKKEASSESAVKKSEDRRTGRFGDSGRRPAKNPIALLREKEERERERIKREAEKKQKNLRTQRYLEKVKEKKSAKEQKTRPSSPASAPHMAQRPAPKTWLGKFIRWWSTP
jgi:superfamily II DNA/RNA helicase